MHSGFGSEYLVYEPTTEMDANSHLYRYTLNFL